MSAVLREMGTGLDYPDLDALLSGMSGAVGSGNWLIGRYVGSSWNGSPDTSSDIYFGSGTRVDGALYWQIEADEANRFTGTADTSKVVLTGGLLNANETGDIRFVGLQFAESTSFCLRSQDFGQMTIDNCLVTSTTRCFLGWGGDLLVRNSVFRGASAGCIIIDNGGQTVLAHNNLFANAGYGIVRFSGTATATACIGYDAQFSGTFTSSDYNVSGGASGATSAPTAGGHYLHSIADPCTNLAGGIFTIDLTDGAPLIGFGPDLRAHGTLPVVFDFAGQERPAASTVGPSEGDPVPSGTSHTGVGVENANSSGTGTLGQNHALVGVGAGNTNSSGTGTLAQNHSLVGTGANNANGVGTGALAQRHNLSAVGASNLNGVGSPALNGANDFTASGANCSNGVGSPSFVQDHALAATGGANAVEVGSPAFETLSTALGASCGVQVGSPSFAQNHVFEGFGADCSNGIGTASFVGASAPGGLRGTLVSGSRFNGTIAPGRKLTGTLS